MGGNEVYRRRHGRKQDSRVSAERHRAAGRAPLKRDGVADAEPDGGTVWLHDASDIYRQRFGAEGHSNEDIAAVPMFAIPQAGLLVGGFPCQDYSVASGRGANMPMPLRGVRAKMLARRDVAPYHMRQFWGGVGSFVSAQTVFAFVRVCPAGRSRAKAT